MAAKLPRKADRKTPISPRPIASPRPVAAARPAPRKRALAKPKPALAIPESFRALAKAFEKERGITVEKGWGSSNVVLKLRGKMFVLLVDDELVLKLPKERVDELIDEALGRRFDPRKNGKLMKEWIVLGPGRSNWLRLAREAHRFALE